MAGTIKVMIQVQATPAFAATALGARSTPLDVSSIPGAELDVRFGSVPLPQGKLSRGDTTPVALSFAAAQPSSYITRANVPSESLAEFLKWSEDDPNVVGVFADPVIQPIRICPGSPPKGTHLDVERLLSVSALWSRGMDGTGVKAVIVDTGVNMSYLASIGKTPSFDDVLSWGPHPPQPLGNMPVDHGTMCAFDVCIAAPRCTLVDHALLTSNTSGGSVMEGFLSDAVRSFSLLLSHIASSAQPFAGDSVPRPLVVNNSWGMFHESWDFPVGDPQNYSDNPNHPFNIVTASLEAAGADILFAAGNCGPDCPDRRCQNVTNAGIFGANSSEAVTCVGGVDIAKDIVGYSTAGPGRLFKKKPDVTSFTHFAGSGVYAADGGTSAATPVLAGVVTAIRRLFPPSVISPRALREIIRETADAQHSSGFDFRYGFGIINVESLIERLEEEYGATANGSSSQRSTTRKKKSKSAVRKKSAKKTARAKQTSRKKSARKKSRKK